MINNSSNNNRVGRGNSSKRAGGESYNGVVRNLQISYSNNNYNENLD